MPINAHVRGEESVLLYLTSEDASSRDLSSFKINMGNSLHGEKVKVLAPISAKITNIFPNINKYINMMELTAGDRRYLPVGFYNATDLVTAINTLIPENTLSFDPVTSRFTWTVVVNKALILELEFWHALGFDASQLIGPAADGRYIMYDLNDGTALHPPNLSGESMVFIDCDTLAPSNMMHGKDGKSHNTVFMIPLNTTPYGSSTTYSSPDLHMYTIQYRDGRSLSSSLNCQLFDRKMRPLDYPPNMHVYMMFKVYHGEHD